MNRYQDIRQIKNENEFVGTLGDKYYRTTYYPEIEPHESDIYVETEFGDRLDLLANQFYGDVTLYWIISISNPNKLNLGSITIPPGTQLRIPVNINGIVSRFNQLNAL
tara:strand:- start:415 stop:738 length:324 start_codon:yes stop_codon:yes gene_type:complete